MTESENQSHSGFRPSQTPEPSPMTESFTLTPLSVSTPSLPEEEKESVPDIPDEHRASVADVREWLELSLLDGGRALGEIMELIKGVFASIPGARGWIWRSLSDSEKRLLQEFSPDDYGWLGGR